MKQRTINIATGTGTRRVKALVVGKWAAHERWNRRGENWVVTLIGDGRCLDEDGETFGFFDELDAIKVASAMDHSGLRSIKHLDGSLYVVEAIVAEALA